MFAATALWLGGTGMIGRDVVGLFVIGLPALAIGAWAGLKLFGSSMIRRFGGSCSGFC